MRVAFSIIFNGIHHLKHNSYAEYLAKNLDLWIIAEGASFNQGSTRWCKPMPEKYHDGCRSIDGTCGYLWALRNRYYNTFITNLDKDGAFDLSPYMDANGFWKSKDHQVNSCIELLKYQGSDYKKESIFLWQIDIDEQWRIEDMQEAEQQLLEAEAKTGMFLADYWVGKTLQAKGEWGEGLKHPYRRLWLWEGEYFKTHEPPVLESGNGKEILLPQRFQHYAYYFAKDVQFKNDWYSGHEGIYKRWKLLQEDAKNFDIGQKYSLSCLLDSNSYWGGSNTIIVKVKK